MIRALLIDDEHHANGLLKAMIENQFSHLVKVEGTAATIQEARQILFAKKIDLVFLDIKMPEENGFELFTYFPNPTFDVIFVTAFDHYAIQAFKYSAFDYLLKPINRHILDKTLQRYLSQKTVVSLQKEQIALLQNYIENVEEGKKRMLFHTATGVELPLVNSILYFKASGNYCDVYIKGGLKFVVTQSLKGVEDRLPESLFIRTHKSFVVAINAVLRYDRNKKCAVLSDDSRVDVSYRRETIFLKTVLEKL